MIAAKQKIEPAVQPKARLRRRKANDRFPLVLTVVMLASTVAIGYTAACATATSKGYSRTRMYSELKQLQTENQLLGAEVRRLESPERLAVSAPKLGMELRCQTTDLRQSVEPVLLENKVASNPQVNP